MSIMTIKEKYQDFISGRNSYNYILSITNCFARAQNNNYIIDLFNLYAHNAYNVYTTSITLGRRREAFLSNSVRAQHRP